jgi:hypothetical protein
VAAFFAEWWSGLTSADWQGQNTAYISDCKCFFEGAIWQQSKKTTICPIDGKTAQKMMRARHSSTEQQTS